MSESCVRVHVSAREGVGGVRIPSKRGAGTGDIILLKSHRRGHDVSSAEKKNPEASPVYQLRPSRLRRSGGGGSARAGAGPSSVLRRSRNSISPTGSTRGEDGPGREERTHTYAFRQRERGHRGAAETHGGPTRPLHATR